MQPTLTSLLADARLGLKTASTLALRESTLPACLPSQIHEWFSVNAWAAPRLWHPPLTILTSLAARAVAETGTRIAWIGKNCWPVLEAIQAAFSQNAGNPALANVLSRCLFLDPLTDAERYWAIGETLRCPGIGAVVADASGMNLTVSRRLQLAAEAGHAVGLLARPPTEIEKPSWAATRWRVRPQHQQDQSDKTPAWEIELLSCRGQHREQDAPRTWIANWSYQVFRGTGALALSAVVGRRTAPTPENHALGDAARPRRHEPLLLTITAAQQEKVARCCPHAAAAGVRPGMPVAEARSLCPEARLVAFDAQRSRQSMHLLAKWCLRFSPVVAVDDHPAPRFDDLLPDGLLLDVTGEAHLFGSEHLLLTEIATRLRAIGFTARLALAPTIGAAWAVARYGPHPLCVVHENHLRRAIESLPVGGLRLTPKLCDALRLLGIDQIRHLLALPRESLLARFDELLLLRLDQAMGRSAELIEPLRTAEPLDACRIFEGATTQLEAILITVQELLAELQPRLLEKESGIRGLRVELRRINAPPATRELVVGRATRDAAHLWSLLRPKVEQMHLGYGVEAIFLLAFWTERIAHRQTGAWHTGEAEDAHDQEYAALLDTLVNRWGSRRVLTAHAVASHVPEQSRTFVPTNDASKSPTHEELLLMDRPTILLETPEAADVIFLQPDHPPSHMRWRGDDHHLRHGTRPERIVTAWWNRGDKNGKRSSTRDYFRIQTDRGLWLWLFRELESNKWYVHGLW